MAQKFKTLDQSLIDQIKKVYSETQNSVKTAKILKLDNRTVKKYLGNEYLDESTPDSKIVELYELTGDLSRVSDIIGFSRVTVWRALQRKGVKVGKGSNSWKRLYSTIRQRVTKSNWRKNILERDNYTCQKCGEKSKTVHHLTKLSDIRDKILKMYPDINPFLNYQEMTRFSNLVLKEHDNVEGITLCSKCHELEHSKK